MMSRGEAKAIGLFYLTLAIVGWVIVEYVK